MKLINSVALKQEIANVMPSRTEVFLVIDAMPDAIVRCKDCKYWHETIYDTPKWMPCMSVQTSGDWFCADGERKEE